MRNFTSVLEYTDYLINQPSNTSKIIRLQSPNKGLIGSSEHKCWVEPYKDKHGRLLGAVEALTREQIESNEYIPHGSYKDFTGHWRQATKVLLKDGVEFDLNDPIQARNWGFVKYSPLIVVDKKALLTDNRALFYIEMPMEYQMADKLSSFEIKLRAMELINNIVSVDLIHVAKMLGYNLTMMEDVVIKTWLYEFVNNSEEKAKQVQSVIQAPDYVIALLFLKCKDKGIIYYQDNMFRYGDRFLGSTETQVKELLKDPANKELVEDLNAELKGKSKSKK